MSALTAGALFTTVSGAHASEAHRAPVAASASANEDEIELTDAQWENVINQLIVIPEDVLERGDQATLDYLKQLEKQEGGKQSATAVQQVASGWFNFACIGAVSIAVGSNLLPAAKMLKIVKVAKRVGVKRIVRAIKAIRKGRGHTLGNDLQWVGTQLLGLGGVKAACA
ncbi:hypothetical protein [Streptomyces cucumeris]|uniref:hypothetical protein n=1 Tax=Streptomyces cucumeris TaxID=2962890 RepID=UPI0020C8352F|nr:hypothetical protein [Streptomyces sp. NEAU-Y11]MCP9213312.1 hypothetical protein [Streptomyces sp. NEAU-Y11]